MSTKQTLSQAYYRLTITTYDSANVEVTSKDFAAFAKGVDPSGGEKGVTETHVGGADDPHITLGKPSARRVQLPIIYNSLAGNPYDFLMDAFEAGQRVRVDYSPGGAASGQNQEFVYDFAEIANVSVPQASASGSDEYAFDALLVATSFSYGAI